MLYYYDTYLLLIFSDKQMLTNTLNAITYSFLSRKLNDQFNPMLEIISNQDTDILSKSYHLLKNISSSLEKSYLSLNNSASKHANDIKDYLESTSYPQLLTESKALLDYVDQLKTWIKHVDKDNKEGMKFCIIQAEIKSQNLIEIHTLINNPLYKKYLSEITVHKIYNEDGKLNLESKAIANYCDMNDIEDENSDCLISDEDYFISYDNSSSGIFYSSENKEFSCCVTTETYKSQDIHMVLPYIFEWESTENGYK